MTKRNRILCLCLAILATAAVAFFLLYPHTTGPVLPRSGDAHIQAVELRADGELRVWSPKTEEDREKELVILDFLGKSGIFMGIDADGKFELLSGIFYGNYTGTIVDRKLCSREVDL